MHGALTWCERKGVGRQEKTKPFCPRDEKFVRPLHVRSSWVAQRDPFHRGAAGEASAHSSAHPPPSALRPAPPPACVPARSPNVERCSLLRIIAGGWVRVGGCACIAVAGAWMSMHHALRILPLRRNSTLVLLDSRRTGRDRVARDRVC